MKSFWITYAFCFVSTVLLTLITQDLIISSAWSLLLSLAVYLFFDVWYFEEDEEKNEADGEEKYIAILTIKH
ncbi:hypothetical protein [Staphylococcus carnosus]|uniref:Uncharacterized protein n=1 Tax=Staphylococcus carnosus TaxID=1281 RepID=A0AAJ0JNA9_STACA|nr:hypothetical protein [Staphylococcus carnosus]KKB24963.1 hypothetical protein VV61_07735 [Staphylococcus carnosus]POA02246.1 hypothetical protein CD153_06590 [Staphylococcus carnosus]QQS85850.1 hypothetical protein I6J04_03390 [Staphylococcus carnosus]QRQ05785.1 hypothetical protein I6J34_03725 [Staphylococcus carnosus]UTB82223.1 hypothetical protein A2I67_02450 [Staphylococcus carnosus]